MLAGSGEVAPRGTLIGRLPCLACDPPIALAVQDKKDPPLFGSALDQLPEACYTGFASHHPEPIVEYRIPFANLLIE